MIDRLLGAKMIWRAYAALSGGILLSAVLVTFVMGMRASSILTLCIDIAGFLLGVGIIGRLISTAVGHRERPTALKVSPASKELHASAAPDTLEADSYCPLPDR